MMAAALDQPLIDRMPQVRGRMRANASLANLSWFRVGGPAEVLFVPKDLEDLSSFLAAKPGDVPVTVIGVCSNLLVRDGGIDGVVVRLGRGLAGITTEGPIVTAGGGALDVNVARVAMGANIDGMAFLSGVPGTIGGAVRMNAGAYGTEISDILLSITAIDAKGSIHELASPALEFQYRHSSLPADWIVCEARLQGRMGSADDIDKHMNDIREAREATQPIRERTGGSTFTNPVGYKAWELIDKAGCRGLQVGGAKVSEKHCNFLINTGTATAADLETLGETVRNRVFNETGVQLDWEIRRIGKPLQDVGCLEQ